MISKEKWEELDYSDKLDKAIEVMQECDKANQELSMDMGDFGEVTVELVNTDNGKTVWLKIVDKPTLDINLWPGDNSHPLIDDRLWDCLFDFLEGLQGIE